MGISSTLANNGFWKKLVTHREAISTFMREDKTYNPFYLQKAFACVDEKYKKEQRHNRAAGYDRLALLSIRGIGRIQACGPVLVTMLFARGALWDFYNNKDDPAALDAFNVERNIEFKNVVGSPLQTSPAGVLELGEKYWADVSGGGIGGDTRVVAAGLFCQPKNTRPGQHINNQHHAPNERMCNAVISCPNESAITKRNG